MAKYSYCYGIVKDDNFMERVCEKRDDCVYYHIDNMRHYWGDPDYEMFFPPVGGDCPFFVQREKEIKEKEFVSFF